MDAGEPEVLVVRLVGLQDRAAARAIQAQVAHQVAARGACEVTLDFAEAPPLSLFGLGTLLALSAHVKQAGGCLRLANLGVEDREGLALLGLGDLLAEP